MREKTYLTLFLLGLLIFNCHSFEPKIVSDFYIYSAWEFSCFFKKIGYKDFKNIDELMISRNSDGTELRFFHRYKNIALFIDTTGTIVEKKVPGVVAWFDDKQNTVIWCDWDKEGKHVYVHYPDSSIEQKTLPALQFAIDCGLDQTGEFMIRDQLDSPNQFSYIYHVNNPQDPLEKVPIVGGGITRMYSSKNKLFLIGWNESAYPNVHDIKTCFIYEIKDDVGLNFLGSKDIARSRKSPTGWWAVDVNFNGDKILMIDNHDWPERSKYFVYDIKKERFIAETKEPISGGRGFYLQKDILRETLKKQKNK